MYSAGVTLTATPELPPVTVESANDRLQDALQKVVPESRLLRRPIERIAFASDASFYRLIPRVVALASTVEEVKGLLAISRAHRVPLTFRAAGTSLSGQAVTDGLLVEVARHWKRVVVEDEGRRVRVQPGVIGDRINQVLKAHAARLGPDPASINACTIGGILANNSSGMCCGVAQNAYHTLESLTFVLPVGHGDRHGRTRRGRAVPGARAADCGRAARDQAGDRGAAPARRPHPRRSTG